MILSFRPHHFLCTIGFKGMGYSPSFVENYSQIMRALQQDDELSIQVVVREDSICAACPHQSLGNCIVEEKIQTLDANHGQILNLQPGDILSWREAKQRLKHYMTLEAFHKACAVCEWKSWGVCEKALKKLHATDS